jgi:hypothetical protein
MLYESTEAPPLVYAVDNLEAARAEQVSSATQLNAIRAEDLRKTGIPITIVLQVHDEIFQAIAATLKSVRAKSSVWVRIPSAAPSKMRFCYGKSSKSAILSVAVCTNESISARALKQRRNLQIRAISQVNCARLINSAKHRNRQNFNLRFRRTPSRFSRVERCKGPRSMVASFAIFAQLKPSGDYRPTHDVA